MFGVTKIPQKTRHQLKSSRWLSNFIVLTFGGRGAVCEVFGGRCSRRQGLHVALARVPPCGYLSCPADLFRGHIQKIASGKPQRSRQQGQPASLICSKCHTPTAGVPWISEKKSTCSKSHRRTSSSLSQVQVTAHLAQVTSSHRFFFTSQVQVTWQELKSKSPQVQVTART